MEQDRPNAAGEQVRSSPADAGSADGNSGVDAVPDGGDPDVAEGGAAPCDGEEPTPGEPDHQEDLRREIERLEEELAQRDRRLREYIEAHQHAVAEMDAARQRMQRDREEELDRGRARVAEILLGLADDLERALAGATSTDNLQAVVDGVGMVHEQMRHQMRDLGVERMDTVGQRFDPTLHEAVGMVPVSDPGQDQVIVGEDLAGYLFKGRLLRAARVIVGSHVDT